MQKKLLDLNCYFSASGIITFKNSSELRDTFSIFQMKKLIIETDSPFFSTNTNERKKNEPSFIKYTLEKLAEIKKKHFNDMDKITTDNFNKLFSLNEIKIYNIGKW